MNEIDVVCAIIIRDGLIYCVQRGNKSTLPNKWEFPGGKIEKNENEIMALKREIHEELDCFVDVSQHFSDSQFSYEFGTVNLKSYICSLKNKYPKISEHKKEVWLKPSELHNLDWAAADIPIVEKLKNNFK